MARQTNVSRRRAQAQSGREKAALARAEQQRRERRRRLLVIVGSVVAVLAVVGVIVAVGVLSKPAKKSTSSDRTPAPATVVADVRGVPQATLDAIGTGTLASVPKAVHDTALTSGGKPQVLFVGAEFCPYCAAERWALVQALSRFGSFSNLSTTHSSPTDVHPNTATFSFHGASYSSGTVAFTGREVETVSGSPLDTMTSAESTLFHRYTGTPGSFPFLDIGGRYVVTAPSYDAGVLKGLTAEQIAAALKDPSSPVAKAVDGAANVLTAAICKVTNGQPASVCSAAGVTAAAKVLGA